MVRAVFRRGEEKIKILDTISIFLIARIGLEPDAAQRCNWQYDSCPKHKHNKVSVEVLDHSSPLRQMIQALPPVLPQVLPLELDKVVVRVRHCSLLDKLAEGPRATFKRVGLHSRRAEFPWQSATMRLDKDLDDVDELPALCGVDLQNIWGMWDNWKSLLDPRGNNNIQRARKMFLQRVYRCSHHFADDGGETDGAYDGA